MTETELYAAMRHPAEDTSDLDTALAELPITPPTLAGAPTPRKHRHVWNFRTLRNSAHAHDRYPLNHDCEREQCGGLVAVRCFKCGNPYDAALSRRGKQSRNYGNRAELSAARKYGGEKIGHAGGPVDIRGEMWNTQVKTHRRLPPAEWRKAFSGMAASGERLPRLLLRFLPGPGLPPDDYMVVPAKAWLDWFGKDE